MSGVMARAGCMALLAVLSGCSSLSSEKLSYPEDWPALNKAAGWGCTAPAGTFENLPFRTRFEYGESPNQYLIPAPRLNDVLGVAPGADPTHLLLTLDESNSLIVSAFESRNGKERLLDTRVINRSETGCQNHRWLIATETTHQGWADSQDPDYDPTVTAAYLIGTFGLIAPISRWFNYVLMATDDGSLALRRENMESALFFLIYSRAAMDDDWFLYRSTVALR